MLTDRIMGVAALILFTIFLAVVAWKIRYVDFAIAAAIGVGLASFDLWTQLGPGRRRKR